MGYKLKLDLPNAGKGVEVYLDGLGSFENGAEHDITDEQAAYFRVAHQKVKDHKDDDTGLITHVDVEPGPTLLEYYKDREGIEVTTSKAESKKSDPVPGASGKKDPVDSAKDKDPADGSGKGGS